MKNVKFLFLILFSFILCSVAFAQEVVVLEGKDNPNDRGNAILLNWKINDKAQIEGALKINVFRKKQGDEKFEKVKTLDVSSVKHADKKNVDNKVPYLYYLEFVDVDKNVVLKTSEVGPFVSKENWFKANKTANLIFSFISITIILFFIEFAKKGKKLYIRPLAGVKAIEDAVGRATEMGKSCVYSPGISYIEDVSTLASISIVSKVSEIIAEYNSRLIVPNYDPIVYSVIDEVVKNSYVKAGRPDAYKPEDVYFLTQRQFAYASGISGLMAREKPAANFFLGWFMAESLILAEAGSMTGAIQIAGTDSISQIPFFIVACDYTLIGEELYAAGAYMGNDTKLLGGLKGQDYVKLVLMITLVVLFFLKLFGVPGISTLLTGGN